MEDPAVRKDGKCATKGCGKPRPSVNTKSQFPNLESMLSKDPFCSATCCRAYYGVKLKSPESARKYVRPGAAR